jgi:alanyl-tRNA synthetase
MKTSEQIRQDFFDFFQSKQHLIVPSAPLVPKDDATLMFINSGMAPFKKCFLGTEAPPALRVADTQKCLRVSGKHNDLEEVGVDTYHHTLFEMLGNWSFGDYFKKEALAWSWELLTEVWGLNPDRLYVTVHEGESKWNLSADEEAIEIWKQQKGMAEDHILFGSSKDNFWMMGDTGPCGPCSEIHYDGRTDVERAAINGRDLVNMDDPRVVEIWNNVFIQYNALPDGTLEPLKAKHVDTGMGFERIVRTIQGKDSNYDTDIFQPLFVKLAELSPLEALRSYDDIDGTELEKEQIQIAMRVIVDHIRTVSFATADGAPPSNDGKGYVIKRILRRAIRYGYQVLGFREAFMWRLVETLKNKMGAAFPELEQQQSFIERVIKGEEESFFRTLKTGIELFQKAAEKEGKISGEAAFQLHDTFGFPIDLTKLMAREQGLDVDEEGYEVEMQQQKTRARAASSFKVDQSKVDTWEVLSANAEGTFVGYDTLEVADAHVVAVKTMTNKAGEFLYFLALDSTPFYAESGGQVGDKGTLRIGTEEIEVLNTTKDGGYIAHQVAKLPDDLSASVDAKVHADARQLTSKHHTATHLLHQALREQLGTHVQQKGSLVEANRLRFDFSHFQKVEQDELSSIESRVNELIGQNLPLQEFRDLPIEEAKSRGAMALFGEKYGNAVRMIQFGESKELCGGTHVQTTSEVNLFKFTSEGSVASGIRRVEAVVSDAALAFLNPELIELRQTRALFKSKRSLVEEVSDLQEKLKAAEKEISALKQVGLVSQLEALIASAQVVNDIRLVTGKIQGADGKMLGELAQTLRDKLGANSIAVIGAVDGDKVFLAATVSDDLNKQGKQAGKLIGEVARLVGGGGGGRPQIATAGGKQPENLDAALAKVAGLV